MNEGARRIIAVFLSFGLFSIVTIVGGFFLGSYSLYPFLFLALSHAIAAGVLGYIWPHIGWRIGLWMFLVWPLFLLVGFLLTADYLTSGHANWKDIFVVLLFCFSILPVGCIGGWLGAAIKGRLGGGTISPIKSSSA